MEHGCARSRNRRGAVKAEGSCCFWLRWLCRGLQPPVLCRVVCFCCFLPPAPRKRLSWVYLFFLARGALQSVLACLLARSPTSTSCGLYRPFLRHYFVVRHDRYPYKYVQLFFNQARRYRCLPNPPPRLPPSPLVSLAELNSTTPSFFACVSPSLTVCLLWANQNGRKEEDATIQIIVETNFQVRAVTV